MKIAVIGGGISGLTCAHTLASLQSNIDVTVFERANYLGGKIRTSDFCSMQVDEGPDAFLARKPAGLDLCEQLGLRDALVTPTEHGALLLDDSVLRPFPRPSVMGVPQNLASLTRSRILSVAGMLRTLYALVPSKIPAGDPTLAEVLRPLGREATEKLVEPLVGGINAGRANNLSAASVAPQIAALARTGKGLFASAKQTLANSQATNHAPVLVAPRDGMATLVKALVNALDGLGVSILTDTVVENVANSEGKWQLTTRNANNSANTGVFDAVVFATPTFVTAKLINSIEPELAQLLESIEYADVAMVRIAFNRSDITHDLLASGYLSVPAQRRLFSAASFASTKWKRLDNPDIVIFRMSSGRIDDARATKLSDQQLIDAAARELQQVVGAKGSPIASDVIRWNQSFPQYNSGHAERIAEVESLAHQHPGLEIIGAATHGLGITSCIATAKLGAERVLASIDTSPTRSTVIRDENAPVTAGGRHHGDDK